jgi:hypothetical protein
MGYESSMIYTMGTALGRALEDNSEVAVLVNGVWLSGAVVIHDGIGVVLDNGDEHSIVKVDQIAAIKVLTALPSQARITDGEAPVAPWGQAMPMPGPRAAGNS